MCLTPVIMKFFQVWVENSPPLIPGMSCFTTCVRQPARLMMWPSWMPMPPGCVLLDVGPDFGIPQTGWAGEGFLPVFAPCRKRRGRMDVLDAVAGWFSCLTFVYLLDSTCPGWFWSHVCVYDFETPSLFDTFCIVWLSPERSDIFSKSSDFVMNRFVNAPPSCQKKQILRFDNKNSCWL